MAFYTYKPKAVREDFTSSIDKWEWEGDGWVEGYITLNTTVYILGIRT